MPRRDTVDTDKRALRDFTDAELAAELRNRSRRRCPQAEEGIHGGTLVWGTHGTWEDLEECPFPPTRIEDWFPPNRRRVSDDAGFPEDLVRECDRVFPSIANIYKLHAVGPVALQCRGWNTAVLVTHGTNIWMSDSVSERIENLAPFRAAHGEVSILGLGLGMLPLALCAHKADVVRRITIVEACTEVIALVWPQFCWARRQIERLTGRHVEVRLHEGDAREYRSTRGFDTIWADFWAGKDASPEKLAEYAEVGESMRYNLVEGGWYGAWFEPALRRMAADPSWPVKLERVDALLLDSANRRTFRDQTALACVDPDAYPPIDVARVEAWRAHLAVPVEDRLRAAIASTPDLHDLQVGQSRGRWVASVRSRRAEAARPAEGPREAYGSTAARACAELFDHLVLFDCLPRDADRPASLRRTSKVRARRSA